jgi:hypothetical protein
MGGHAQISEQPGRFLLDSVTVIGKDLHECDEKTSARECSRINNSNHLFHSDVIVRSIAPRQVWLLKIVMFALLMSMTGPALANVVLPPCQTIVDDLAALKVELNSVQGATKEAAAERKLLNNQINAKKADLEKCLKKNAPAKPSEGEPFSMQGGVA